MNTKQQELEKTLDELTNQITDIRAKVAAIGKYSETVNKAPTRDEMITSTLFGSGAFDEGLSDFSGTRITIIGNVSSVEEFAMKFRDLTDEFFEKESSVTEAADLAVIQAKDEYIRRLEIGLDTIRTALINTDTHYVNRVYSALCVLDNL